MIRAVHEAPRRPLVSREDLIANERAAERRVVEAEQRLAILEAQAPTTAEEREHIELARDELTRARQQSLALRAEMRDGLDAWTRYLAYGEAVKLNGGG